MAKAYGSAARTQAAEKIKDSDMPDFMDDMDMEGMPQQDDAPLDAPEEPEAPEEPAAPSGPLDQNETEELISLAQGKGKSMAEALEIVEIVEEFMAGGGGEDEGMPMDAPFGEAPEGGLEEEV